MAEQAASVDSLEVRLSRLFPGMVWPEFPQRDGSRLIPIDRELAGPLFALLPDWAGDWANFENALRKHGNFTTAELPNASIKNISQAAGDQAQENMERRAARGLECSGASGTSVSTFYAPTLLAPIVARPAAEDDEITAVVKRIKTPRRMQILLVMRVHGATSAATAMKKADIADEIQAIDPTAGRAFRKPFEFFCDIGLTESGPGTDGGHWLTPEGIRAADYIEQHISGMEHVAKRIRRGAG